MEIEKSDAISKASSEALKEPTRESEFEERGKIYRQPLVYIKLEQTIGDLETAVGQQIPLSLLYATKGLLNTSMSC